MTLRKIAIGLVAAAALCLLPIMYASERVVAAPTTVFVVRHAEKTGDVDNPALSPAGEARAKALSHVVKSVKLSAVFATATKRARQTATPAATATSLAITEYSDINALVSSIHADFAGKNVLVIGHSNTVPTIVRKLSGSSADFEINEEFDNFFVVVVGSSADQTVVHRLRYGASP